MTRTVILTQDEAGWWIATCPSLPGCVSQGETRAEALANIAEAIRLSIMVFEKLFRSPPARPAPEVAGYGCEARLRGLDRAMPNYFLKLHKPWLRS
ncbi:MAG: type II toxin-antitoxin system HicB family antitoxin [Roseiflexus sp.]|nr:type II toxin-antitoxin system HicB family antitoxin [Roseiflexus sp.]